VISVHVLFVDDEPDIREIIELSLGLDSMFALWGCSSGQEALHAAGERRPDLILLDVMMPGMDGPTTLAKLRENTRTGIIPVVFMTARTQAYECKRFIDLGAAGVIAKPFDPMNLAAEVRRYIPCENKLAPARDGFLRRVAADASALAACRSMLADQHHPPATVVRIKDIAHALAGASGIYGFAGISSVSAALEEAAAHDLAGQGNPHELEQALDRVLSRIDDH
jgi:CheY-like chemotaxis protein